MFNFLFGGNVSARLNRITQSLDVMVTQLDALTSEADAEIMRLEQELNEQRNAATRAAHQVPCCANLGGGH
jgi:predicted helicase